MNNKNSFGSKNVMVLIISLLLTISVLAILTIYTFQTIILTKKIEKALYSFENTTLKILIPNQVYTNVNVNIVTNYLPKGNAIGSNIIINELVITNDIKSPVNIINAKSSEDITKAIDNSLDTHYEALQYLLKDNNRSLIILFLIFSIFIFVVCIITIGINNNTLAKTQSQAREVETRMLFTLTENNKNMESTIKTIREENDSILKEVKKETTLNSLLNKALVNVLNKNYDNAIKLYSEALSIDFLNSEIYSNRANAYIQNGLYNEALEDLNKAISMRYDIEENYYNRANIHKMRKEWYEAIEDYSKTLNLNNNCVNAYYNRALAYYNIEEYDHALNNFSKVIELDENNYKAYSNRAYVYIKFYENTTNKLFFDKALEDLNKAIDLEPAYPNTLIHFAYLYMALYKIENKKTYLAKVNKYLEEASSIDKENKKLYFYQGMYYSIMGKKSKADALIAKSAEMGYEEAVRYLFNNNTVDIDNV